MAAKDIAIGAPFVYQDADIDYVLAVVASQLFNGVGAVTLDPPLTLNRNTLVRKYDLTLGAAHAPRTQAQNVAQVRAYSNAGAHTVVIDFGTPRTVSYIDVPSGTKITKVAAWAGAQFGFPFYSGALSYAAFPAEVRAERLLVTLDRALSAATVGEDVTLEIPDLPADLELRIDDAQPVFTNPGAVQPAAGVTAPVVDRWSEQSERLLPLADALNALLADPQGEGSVTFKIELTSKVPGKLALKPDAAPRISHIHRIKFGADTATDVEFEQEGRVELALPLPPPAAGKTQKIEELHLTASAKLPPERVLPPLGPDYKAAPAGAAASMLAELVLDADHAAAVRLGPSGLAELSGVRLPLSAAEGGAEVRALLWSPDPSSGEPLEPLPKGASKPVTLTGGEALDAWTTFNFDAPLPLDQAALPWVAVVVSRGSLSWALADKPAAIGAPGSDSALADTARLRRGAANGPWHALPLPFQSSVAPSVMDARGRVRQIGTGSKTDPVAPLLLSLDGQAEPAELTPTLKGVPLQLNFDPPLPAGAAGPILSIVSRVAGTLTLRDVDIIWREE
ncbi:MAG: hypothetical protein KF778_18790 [Rhodocyclaceae bacterium]|nr:hypothetical protein [Rhodocyclaceae bacterium]